MTPENPEGAGTRSTASGFRLGSILGFEIRIDLSWFVIFFLVFWSLSRAVFPAQLPDVAPRTHLVMGLVGTLLFFASLVLHELSHAIVSRRRGIPVEGITLFIFGGIARAGREPDSPKDELLIAGVGPLTSLVLAGLFELFAHGAVAAGAGEAVWEVSHYLAVLNLALAIFNLMPGFPLDGGRVFRAIAWAATGNQRKATRWAAAGGRGFGTVLIVLGALQALGGAPVGGLWLVFIGWFLRSLAGSSLQQHMVRDWVRGFVAGDLMSRGPEVVPAGLTLDDLVHEHFMRLRFGSYPVVQAGAALGMITLQDVKRVPRHQWPNTTASDAMTPIDQCAVVAPTTSLEQALDEMGRRGGGSRALVMDHGRLVGVVSASDIARWMQRAQAMDDLVGGPV